ncbi:acetyl-CoA carboxylase biotin carboxyl carrier protein [Eubacteriaceae bacterium ES2]|nr:acetyl-CoA carboxylase biotin carboxyl carrier protein [Eubacteriaceae bacterium ES2]
MELTIETIDALSQIMKRDQLTSLSLDQGHLKIEIKREGIATTASPSQTSVSEQITATPSATVEKSPEINTAVQADANLIEITSPMVGVFYQSNQPGKPAFASVGQNFQEGDTLCIVEAMKLMNEITAEYNGKIVEICVANEEVVEFGQVLFRVERS